MSVLEGTVGRFRWVLEIGLSKEERQVAEGWTSCVSTTAIQDRCQ